ncbi:mitochondrial carrier [Viridothelium virens]|uniref:Mitochondrial thiamine pyrophosphate carrier 1 n=1 Tax=Viridothelium virens TaxID=1048519 RepID=A0A6A6GWV6_VIRVR|nr:mitochondrial carrier [Viridothelium virens]
MDDDKQRALNRRVEQLWKTLDTRNEGQLDVAGLKEGLRNMNHPLQNADNLINDVLKVVDSNGDGRIQYSEFRTFVEHTEKELLTLFKSIDRDHNGNLDKDELQLACTRAGLLVNQSNIDRFFSDVDKNHDGVISFDEWRDFLLFIPTHDPGLKAILSYYSAAVKVNPEGDVSINHDAMEGLGKRLPHLSHMLFGSIIAVARPPPKPRPPDSALDVGSMEAASSEPESLAAQPDQNILLTQSETPLEEHAEKGSEKRRESVLTEFLPDPGYFLAGGLAGVASRTSTAPLDRLKVYLIAQTGVAEEAVAAAKKGAALKAARHSFRPLVDASKELWAAGGIRSLFAGNGLNVIKVMPESAVKFGSYEGAKRLIARAEGHGDPKKISPVSQFVAGGLAGMISQFVVYPIDTLKFRMQCETVAGGLHGNALILDTLRAMWRQAGVAAFYRGLPMGLVGMFPYAAIDLGTFEALKKLIVKRNINTYHLKPNDPAANPGSVTTAFVGGFSGALGASMVYPLNLLRTRLQSQGTKVHPRTYTGMWDVTQQTIKGEGFRGLFKGLTPNLLKVVPAVSITYVVYEKSKVMFHLK